MGKLPSQCFSRDAAHHHVPVLDWAGENVVATIDVNTAGPSYPRCVSRFSRSAGSPAQSPLVIRKNLVLLDFRPPFMPLLFPVGILR
jgi:hypothetical protein